MGKQQFHISTLAAVAQNQIWLAQGGIHDFCGLLVFLTGKDQNDIWNSDDIRHLCREELITQLPFLADIETCSNCPRDLTAWHNQLEQKFGSHFVVKRNGQILFEVLS
jgi:hypothetical protein